MSKIRHQTVLFGSPDELEATFYEALYAADIEKLMGCWSDDDGIICVHPGGARLVGANTIRLAFEAIFIQGGAIRIYPQAIRRIDAMTSAVHSVLERIELMTSEGPAQAFVLATNVYHKTPQGWRMVLHHASPGAEDEFQEFSRVSPTLH